MNLDWLPIDDFKISGFEGGWQFKYLRSFIRYGTLDENMPGNLGVYMVILMSGSTLEFVVKGSSEFYQRKNPNVQITRLKRAEIHISASNVDRAFQIISC